MVGEKDFLFAGRVFSFRTKKESDDKLVERLLYLVKKCKPELTEFMDRYYIPPVVYVNLKKGDGSLEGMYRVGGSKESLSIITFDLYTMPFDTVLKSETQKVIDYELLDTFVHELIHNKHKEENKTQRLSKKFMSTIKKKL